MYLTRLIIPLLLFLIIFTQPSNIWAQEEVNIKNEFINPGSFYYSFKRIWEKGWEKLQFSQSSKVDFHKSQLNVRLAELNYVVENELLSEVQTSSERFAYQAGRLTDEIINQGKDKEQAIGDFAKMQKFLGQLRDKYPANSSFWMLIQHDINSLAILTERLK